MTQTTSTAASSARDSPRDDRRFRLLLFLPTILFLVGMTLFPLLFSLGVSVTDYQIGGTARFVGLANYRDLLADPRFWTAMGNTLLITLFAVAIEIAVGLGLALLFQRPLPGLGALRVVLFIPMMLSPLVIGYFWRFMFDETFGVISYVVAHLLGHPIDFLTQPRLALGAIVLVDVWQWSPLVFLLALAGLGTVPPDLYEVAALQRAPAWMQFTHITLPYLRFPLLLALLFRAIDTLKMFDLVYILTGGGPGDSTVNLSLLTYRYGYTFSQVGRAAALSWLLVVLINVLAMLLIGALRKPQARAIVGESAGVSAGGADDA